MGSLNAESQSPPHPGNIYASEATNVAELKALYPRQFPSEYWNYSWPDGWHYLVVEGCKVLAHGAPHSFWRQIKEKDAGLRLYYAGRAESMSTQTPELRAAIRMLEAASLQTCCLCGGRNGIGTSVLFNSWWLTVCEMCEPLVREHRSLLLGKGGVNRIHRQSP